MLRFCRWIVLLIACSGSLCAAEAGSILLDAHRASPPPILPAMDGCWVETASPLPQPAAKPQRRVSARKHVRRPPRRHRHRVVRRAHRPPPIWVAKPESRMNLVWNCAWPLSLPPPDVEPFTTDFADVMSTTRGNDLVQQWIIDRHMPRRRRSMPPPASTAPEAGTWALMVIGFGLIGAMLRSSRRPRYWGNYQWRNGRAGGDERLATAARNGPIQGILACRSVI